MDRQLKFFAPARADLQQVLDARERRQAAQRAMLSRFGCPLVSFTMNIPGPVKDTPLIELAFSLGLAKILERTTPLALEVSHGAAGPLALMACSLDAARLKEIGQAVEAAAPLGRLFDIDVLDAEGQKLSRATLRRCLVCGGPAFDCARSRAHGLAAVEEAVRTLLVNHAAAHFADEAESALLAEARLTPKPGLVDQANSGAHRDMDLPMMERSARALRPFFERFFRAGVERPDEFPPLKDIGLEAEAAMMAVTGGINTHRGAVFAFGLLLGALGASLLDGRDPFLRAAELAKQRGVGEEKKNSHGGVVRARYGVGGATAEAEAGFPTARGACRVLRRSGALTALLWLLARCGDTNVLYRGGRRGLFFIHSAARLALCLPPSARPAAAARMDKALIRRNLSPGGAADLLALAFFMDRAGLQRAEGRAPQRAPLCTPRDGG